MIFLKFRRSPQMKVNFRLRLARNYKPCFLFTEVVVPEVLASSDLLGPLKLSLGDARLGVWRRSDYSPMSTSSISRGLSFSMISSVSPSWISPSSPQ